MTAQPQWIRLAGFLVVLALALHSAIAVGVEVDLGIKIHCVLCYLGGLAGDLPAPAAPDRLTDTSGPSAAEAPLSVHPSRGPPA